MCNLGHLFPDKWKLYSYKNLYMSVYSNSVSHFLALFHCSLFFFLNPHEDIFIDFRQRGGEREREKYLYDKHRLLPICTPTRNQTHNLGMCPDQESNPQSFGVWDHSPTNDPPDQGCYHSFLKITFNCGNICIT